MTTHVTINPVKVFLVCPGLGHITRGFETFTQECFDALKVQDTLDVRLFKGAGSVNDKREKVLFTLRRTSPGARILGPLLHKSEASAEAISFAVSLLPHLFRERPDIVVFSDWFVGKLLRVWRSMFGFHYQLLLSNGGPFDPQKFCWDHIQQVSPQYLAEALQAGVPLHRQTLLPYGVRIEPEFQALSDQERVELRRSLHLPSDRPIILCVSAINSEHKRIDYLIREVAQMPEPRPFLMILGQREEGADAIENLANSLLGPETFSMRSVPKKDVSRYYQAADVFVLASLREGFGLVFVEALSHGLPCFAHSHPTAQYVLGPYGHIGDFREPGGLSDLLQNQSYWISSTEQRNTLHRYAWDKFSWERTASSYIRMLHNVAGTLKGREEDVDAVAF